MFVFLGAVVLGTGALALYTVTTWRRRRGKQLARSTLVRGATTCSNDDEDDVFHHSLGELSLGHDSGDRSMMTLYMV